LAVGAPLFETKSCSVKDFEALGARVPSGITDPVFSSEIWAGGANVRTELNAVELPEFTTTAVSENVDPGWMTVGFRVTLSITRSGAGGAGSEMLPGIE
jgi:hypothetical protein